MEQSGEDEESGAAGRGRLGPALPRPSPPAEARRQPESPTVFVPEAGSLEGRPSLTSPLPADLARVESRPRPGLGAGRRSLVASSPNPETSNEEITSYNLVRCS